MEKAVALKYITGTQAPFVIAKGKNELARKLVEIAGKEGIHITAMPELAENLYMLDIGEYIPEEYYKIIAEILVFIQKVKVR